MEKVINFIKWALSHAKKATVPAGAELPVPLSAVGSNGEWEYLFGTTGFKITQALLDNRYENHYKNKMTRAEYDRITAGWIGRVACDCEGLLDYYCHMDINADMNYRSCTDKGAIDKNVRYPLGECLFMEKSGKMTHVGFVCGTMPDGTELVVEERGINYGCVITKRSERPWTHHGKTKYLEYKEDEPMEKIRFEVVNPMNQGEAYYIMQDALRAAGYTDDKGEELVVDGKWGKKSQQAFNKLIRDYTPKMKKVEIFIDGKKVREFFAEEENV